MNAFSPFFLYHIKTVNHCKTVDGDGRCFSLLADCSPKRGKWGGSHFPVGVVADIFFGGNAETPIFQSFSFLLYALRRVKNFLNVSPARQ